MGILCMGILCLGILCLGILCIIGILCMGITCMGILCMGILCMVSLGFVTSLAYSCHISHILSPGLSHFSHPEAGIITFLPS